MQTLQRSGHVSNQFNDETEFLDFVEAHTHQVDCLILEDHPNLDKLVTSLPQRSIFLPTLILELDATPEEVSAALAAAIASDSSETDGKSDSSPTPPTLYRNAILRLTITQLGHINQAIEQAIGQFLKISPLGGSRSGRSVEESLKGKGTPEQLMAQQQRLADKLKERLGYLGVYYKRNPQNFLRNMSPKQRDDFLSQLRSEYRLIILSYFSEEAGLNDKIDNFVNTAFFADISVAQIVEMHMELMDDFAKQLKLEGRNEEILLDYRLTLIDAIAHLCEMYRRSIPRES